MSLPIKYLLWPLLAIILAVPAHADQNVPPTTPPTPPRTVSFHLTVDCTCAQCAFDAQRVLRKFEGVQKVSLSIKEHRLDVLFSEAKHPASALARAVAALEMGKNSTLLWSVPGSGDPAKAAAALAQLPGVQSAKAADKSRAVHLTFAAKPEVTFEQLDHAAG